MKIKSLFTKYIILFMAILLACMLILSGIMTSLMGDYSKETKERTVKSAAISFSSLVNLLDDDNQRKTLDECLSSQMTSIRKSLSLLYKNVEGLVIVTFDLYGNVIMITSPDEESGDITILRGAENVAKNTAGVVVIDKDDAEKDTDCDTSASEKVCKTMSDALRESLTSEKDESVKTGKTISGKGNFDGLINDDYYFYAQEIIYGGEYSKGYVMAYTTGNSTDTLLNSIQRTIVIAGLWISIAALITVYILSDRIISPLKSMRDAAKEFSSGKFDARVPVTGHDEVAELAESFNSMAESLSQLEEMRRTFLGNVSHDLRTPMTTISGFVDGILDGTIPPDKQDYYLNIISQEVRRLSRLVSSLLDVSRLQAGERKFTMTSFNICETAREIIISFEQKISAKGLDVEFDCDDEDMYVTADKDAIHQVLYNICDNAVKFSFEKGLYKVSIKNEGARVRVTVYNEGMGIPPDDIKFIFDRFYKSDKSRGLDKTGVGLGMYISRTIIEAHGERISVSSEYGKNCEFTFTLKKSREKQ